MGGKGGGVEVSRKTVKGGGGLDVTLRSLISYTRIPFSSRIRYTHSTLLLSLLR